MDSRIRLLLQVTDQAFDKKSWHGTTLRGAIRGLTPKEALWRPKPKRHNIWELILHAAYWKYIVRRRLTADKTIKFPRKPSNWPDPPRDVTTKSLKLDVRLLQEEHDALQQAILEFPAAKLDARAPKSTWTYVEHIHGIAAHDLYHAGQIQLLKRLMRK